MNHSVAICQSNIIPGGRMRVILGIVEILNEAGIVPDILTSRLDIEPEGIETKYGRPLQARFRQLPRLRRLPQDLSILLFNLMLGAYASRYSLLINTSNSLAFLPKRKNILTYMFFPRKRRIMVDVVSIHRPQTYIPSRSLPGLKRRILRAVYRASKPHPRHHIICLSEYTRAVLQQVYDFHRDLPVIYPPVDMAAFWSNQRQRERAVVTIGRFSPNKRQFEQVQLAEQLPDLPFHIVGFLRNHRYFQQCKDYVESHALDNVHLHPDMVFERMVRLLQSSRFFLHTLINEPFGLTTVHAIAAGCLPLVHDSGGQREVVPKPALRYQDLGQVPEILERVEAMEPAAADDLVRELQEFALSHFDSAVFYDKMKSALAPYL